MRNSQILAGLCGAVALGGVGPALAADDAEAVCEAASSAFEAGVASGDAAKLAATYAPDGQYVGDGGVITGQETIATAPMPPSARLVDALTSSRRVGDLVLCSGAYNLAFAGGPSGGVKGYWTKVVGKVGSDWKILVLTTNTTPGR